MSTGSAPFTLFRLDSSIKREGSVSTALANRVEAAAVDALGDDVDVTRRDLGRAPVPATAWGESLGLLGVPEAERSPEQRGTHALVEELVGELERADGLIIASPLYNWGVSQQVKTWVDVIMTAGRVGPRDSSVAGKPAVLVTPRGGDYRAGIGHPEWDFSTGWLRRILVDIWRLDLTIVDAHLTLAPFHDYMAHLRDDAAAELVRADREATDAGAGLARAIAAARSAAV